MCSTLRSKSQTTRSKNIDENSYNPICYRAYIFPQKREYISAMMNEIRQELRRFAETTGIKGVGRIVKTTSKVIRFFWLISILVCFADASIPSHKVLCTYTSHTMTRSSKVVQTKPIFPDVTICNLFPVYNISSASYNEYLKTIETMKQYDLELQITKDSALWTYMKSIVFYNVNTPLLEEVRDNRRWFRRAVFTVRLGPVHASAM